MQTGSKCWTSPLQNIAKFTKFLSRNLNSAIELMEWDSFLGTVNFVLTDPQYNTLRFGNRLDSDHAMFWKKNFLAFISFGSEAMSLGICGHIFCSNVRILEGISAQAEFKGWFA